MTLAEELAKLHEVQKVDYQIYQREQALKALDTGDALKLHAIEVMKRHDASAAALKKVEAEQRDAELALKTLEGKKAAVHQKLYSGKVTNPKELGDLEKDEEMLAGQVGHQEEVLLELMDRTEAAQTQESALAQELETAKRKWKDTVARSQSEAVRLQKELAGLRPERERLAAQVEKPLLRRYDEIRKSHNGIGLAVTANDICSVCHVKLTPQTVLELREGEDLTFCDNCGRMLAWQKQESS
ncbi:MAG: zinc ribbon domain-containing protein [Armatimonadota bacterium]